MNGFYTMSRILLFLTIALSFAPAAFASSCYSNVEAEAEQGIRIKSELMVIGLNCQHMGKREGMSLYRQYLKFNAQHSELFSIYEEILMRHYKQNGMSSPDKKVTALRTNFANKISNDVASMRPDVFCSRYAPRITKASKMQKEDVRRWAAKIYPSHPVSKPLCKQMWYKPLYKAGDGFS